jgi:hypothetical protein
VRRLHGAVDGVKQIGADRVDLDRIIYPAERSGFFKLAEPVVIRLTRKHFETAAENLKALLEADP